MSFVTESLKTWYAQRLSSLAGPGYKVHIYVCVCNRIFNWFGLLAGGFFITSQIDNIPARSHPQRDNASFCGKRYSFPLVFGGYFFLPRYRRRYTREKISRRSHDGNNNHQDSGASYSIADRCVAAGLSISNSTNYTHCSSYIDGILLRQHNRSHSHSVHHHHQQQQPGILHFQLHLLISRVRQACSHNRCAREMRLATSFMIRSY